MTETTFRHAAKSDTNRIVEILIGDPEQVTTQVGIKLFGVKNVDQLKMVARSMAKATGNWKFTTVAEQNGQVVGFLQVSEASLKMTLGLVFTAIRVYGILFTRELLPRISLLKRVQTDAPADAYIISEIHVAPEYRGQGLGFELLAHGETEARRLGHTTMALQTWTTNPATQLYERFGFKIVETITDDQFKELTGVAGNNLMLKELI